MKSNAMKQRMQRLASMIITGLLFAAAENGQAQLKEPPGGFYLPVMDTNKPVPGLAHAFDGLTVNGAPLTVDTVVDLQEALQLLQSNPPMPLTSVPRKDMGGASGIGFWSLQNPDWPPLPGDIYGVNVWPVGDGRFVLADSQYNYNSTSKVKPKTALTSDLAPPDPGGGAGDTNTYDLGSFDSAVSFSTNDLWLQIVGQNNSVSSLVIHTPWNVTGSNFLFDVFATTNLLPNVPGLNGTNWMFVTRSSLGQTNLFVSPAPGAPVCFFRLGTLQDTDGDGLTDAFEKLVSHTDPNVWDSNGNGIGDGDEISPGGLPWRLMQVSPSSVVIYANAPTATQGGACGETTVYLPSPAPAGGTTVQYYLGGTAGLNSDYTLSPAASSLFIPAGNSYGTITVCASAGSTYSPVKLYADITLTSATGFMVDNTPARVSIVDTGLPGVRVFALPQWVRRPSATYGTNIAGFYFVRDGKSTNALTIGLSFSGSTAAVNSEYSSLPATITFQPNVRTNWLPVSFIPNSTNTSNKTLVLTITNAPGYAIAPTNGAATVTIAATAAPVLPVVQVTTAVAIGTTNTPGQFTFSRSFATASPLRVYLHTWSSTNTVIGTTNGQDASTYTTLPGYVDIPANASSVNLSVTITRQLATPQTISATLAAGDYTIATNNAATVIVDATGPTTVTVDVTRNGLHNGSSGWFRPAELTFTRSGSVANSLSLAWFNVSSGGLGFNATGGQMAGYGVTGSFGVGQIVWPAGQSVIKTNFTVSYVWNNPGVFENDDYSVLPGITFSNAYYYGSKTVPFYPKWELVQISSIFSPATTLTNGTSLPNALYISRPYTQIGTGPQHGLSVTISTSGGSAVSGTDFTMNTTVNINSNQTTVLVPVTALSATNQGWRTLVATLNPAVNLQAVPDDNVDTAYVRLANPNNLVDDTDIDGDGIPDGFELAHLADGLDPITPNNPYADADRDGLGLMEELSLGLNPNVADNAPTYPSIEDSDYVSLTMRVGATGKMLTEPVSSCAVCHAVTMRAGNIIKSTSLTSRTQPAQLADYLVRLARGTNYPVQVTCNPFASSLLTSNQAAATTTPHYTAAYVAQFLADSNNIYPFIVDTNKLLGTNLPMVQEVLPKRATLYIPDLTIAADVDRSGVINFQNRNDRTSATNPFVFWINDDADSGSDDAASDIDPFLNQINSANNTIDGLRDLEDFARLQFKIDGLPPQFLTNGVYQIKIYMTNLVGTPSLRLFPAVDLNGGLNYLTNAATTQAGATMLGVVTNGAPLTIGTANWQPAGVNNYFLPMIFEGISTGSCVVTFGFSSNNAPPVAVSRPFYLNLKKVTDLYEHWTVGDNTTTDWGSIPTYASRTSDSPIFNVPQNSDDLDYIVLVHGWRMQTWERRGFASTAYKRMWQLGYKGRFGLYSWPTDYTTLTFWDFTIQANWQNYDRSEQRAWKSAVGLKELLADINDQSPYRVRLIAHSMGNIVASEALRLANAIGLPLPLVQGYIASQAASVAHAYDATNPAYLLVSPLLRTPEIYGHFPRNGTTEPYFKGMKNAVQNGRIVNFNNVQDFALNSWPLNQSLKPDIGWFCLLTGTNTTHTYWDHTNRLTLDGREEYHDHTYNIFAHIAQAESSALGAAEDATHHLQGEIGGAVDLHAAPFSFGNVGYEHSAEFNSINMNRRTYWWQVLSTFSLTNNLPNP
jgi:hypothetical protein